MSDVEKIEIEARRPVAGEWFELPESRKIGCCDCGLVHDFEFKIVKTSRGPKIMTRVYRDDSTTEVLRGMSPQKCVPTA